MEKQCEEIMDTEPKIAVRCKQCGRILAFKLGSASGFMQLKCQYCKKEFKIDLSMRKGQIYNRKANIPLMITFV